MHCPESIAVVCTLNVFMVLEVLYVEVVGAIGEYLTLSVVDGLL